MEKPVVSGAIELNGDKEAVMIDDQGQELSTMVTSQINPLNIPVNRNPNDGDEVIKGAGVVGGGGGNLGIFPEELWMKILDQGIDSGDILNVFRAFPALDEAFQAKKASWLFGMVLPHLMSQHLVQEEVTGLPSRLDRVHSYELLKLRLVSKRWKYAVEKALENHADRHPLFPRGNNAGLEPNVVAIPEHHFNYQRMWKSRLGVSIFHKLEDINIFLEEMGNYHGNPFPGKSVSLQVRHNLDFQEVVARTVTLLQRFGNHVVDLKIEFQNYCDTIGDLELSRIILRYLALVPKVRSLVFTGQLLYFTDLETNNVFGTPESQDLFPKLANLIKFEWRVEFHGKSNWITRMVETYGKKDGLRRLGIPLNLFRTLDLATHPTIHLTELNVLLDVDFGGYVERIVELVKALPNHQEIRKLCLGSLVPFSVKRVNINGLIRMLAEFQFEIVILQDLSLEEGQPILERLIQATSISSLVLEEEWGLLLSYDFVKSMPNLKYLSVYVDNFNRIEALKEYRKDVRNGGGVEPVDSLGKIMRRYFLKAYDPTMEIPKSWNLWNKIPSLETLNVAIQVSTGGANMVGVQFVREYGNHAFFGPRPDVMELDMETDEEEEDDDDDMMAGRVNE